MEGYLDAPEETRAYFESDDGWGFTGDLALADDEGILTLVGRTKERILSGGINIYPAELESMLSEHPDVLECAVFAVPDKKWGELPAAAVVRRDGASATEGELLDFASERTARFKRVRYIFFVNELPKTGSGKVKRNLLKKNYSGSA
jgi:acyl-CoA synthetase (AMP-forming)/AMP-acid ligase II